MSTPPPSILVVDDDPDTRQNLADILTDLGYSVATAPDGATALDLVRSRPFDVTLLDFNMPGMNGLELYREIRKVQSSIVAIIISAFTNQATTDEAYGAGAWHVMAKPVDFPKLLGLVGEALEQPLLMVVDDDHDLCRNLWDLLRERNYRVSVAHDVSTAVQKARERPYKVVLIAMRLDDGSGADVYDAVHKASPDTRTIMISGHREDFETQIDRAMQEGANAVCYKPFDLTILLAAIDRLSHSNARE